MPKSNHSRNGQKRNRKRMSEPKVRCRFCRRVRHLGHKPGCIGAIGETASGLPISCYS